MIKVIVDGKPRIIRKNMISYHTENDLNCRYQNHNINIARQESGDFYVAVTDDSGSYAVQGGFGGQYCRDGIKTIEDCLVMCIQNILI
jgi:hypothetical protein